MQRLADRVVLVTGAGSGIGRASALRAAAEGARVYCVDIDESAAGATAADVAAAGGQAAARRCDISRAADVQAAVDDCVARFDGLHALVNMAGILRFDDTGQLSLDRWQQVLDVNLTGTLLVCQAALPHLLATRGSIVNAASTAALAGLPCGVAYSASKGGVLAMTRSLAVEYAKRGVRANCVCPGDIKTDMTRDVDFPATMDYSLMGRISSLTGPQGAEVVAGVIAMLISDDGAHITGEDIRIDGGTLS
ncbi:SDR family oxidoreductase [Seongchinamella sediminis]|uniref:SDR family oxidoreductase n=1 Tax=Seongchinamella sediminis TaxID=2283635 RepID=A0A3L7E2M0_9GAMM|nr:SDR family NAD(P)-dependent oxidoreductase [Seongchinamella sediminis]RLQ23794.1 SDR family oxidoreductase [Seongchinamella sediminis]